ncbi:MMPL family transporter [Candidatus Woesearchaeota archaeon]|nr:MMPL family transporter [Candidatus Woesearchaeota archaeon]
MQRIKHLYEKHHKKFFIAPAILIVFALITLISFYNTHGDIMDKDVSLKGGISATVITDKPVDIVQLQEKLEQQFEDADVRLLTEFGTEQQTGILIEIAQTDEQAFRQVVERELGFTLNDDNLSIEVVGSALGASFYQQMIRALLISFVLIAIVVFIAFRSFVPAIATVASIIIDIMVTLAIIDLLGVKISTAGLAAFLLLIGYSVDSDMLLASRAMKQKQGDLMDRVLSAIVTGLTMTVTAIVAVFAGYLTTTSVVLQEIFIILAVGLCVDVIVTYMLNAPITIIKMKQKEGAKQYHG